MLNIIEQHSKPVMADVTMSIVLQRESISVETRSVEAVIVTESSTPSVVFDYVRMEYIDNIFLMSGYQPVDKVSLISDHESYTTDSVLGSVVNLRVVEMALRGRLEFSSDSETESKWIRVKEGHISRVSIGAQLIASQTIEPGETATVEGKTYTAGTRALRINTAWKPIEVSLVVFGADDNARIAARQAAANRNNRSVSKMDWTKSVLVQMGLVAPDADAAAVLQARAALTVEQAAAFDTAVAQLQAADPGEEPEETPAPETEPATEPLPVEQSAPKRVDVAAIRRNAVAAERARVAAIRQAAGPDIPADVLQRAIDGALTVEQANGLFLASVRASRTAPVAPNINTGAGNTPTDANVFAAAVCQSAGVAYVDPRATVSQRAERERVADAAGRFNGMGLLDLAEQCIRLDRMQPEIGREARVQQAFSSTSFNNVLGVVVDRMLMQAFDEAEDSTVGLTFDTDVADYRTVDRGALDKVPTLSPTPEGGTADHASMGDGKESYQVVRYAKQFQVDEITIANDDLGAILRTIMEIGNAANRLRPDLVYATLLANASMRDSVALFHADHNNLLTTGSALASSTLQAAITAMGKQYKQEGKQKIPLNIRAAHLVVPHDLKFLAQILLTSAERNNASENGTFNPLATAGIQIHADDRVGVNGVIHPETGTAYAGTATNYFLFANPTTTPTIEVGYLRGRNRRPLMRKMALPVGRFGVGYDIQHTIGCKALDWRGVLKATGAA